MFVDAVLNRPVENLQWFRGRKLLKSDTRFTIEYNRDTGITSMRIKRTKYSDESKYRIVICSQSGTDEIDFSGFSVFVKGKFADIRRVAGGYSKGNVFLHNYHRDLP